MAGHHGFNQKVFDAGAPGDGRGGPGDLAVIGKVEGDATSLGLVGDVGRQCFHDHRKTDAFGDRCGGCRAGALTGRDRQSGGGEKPLAFPFVNGSFRSGKGNRPGKSTIVVRGAGQE